MFLPFGDLYYTVIISIDMCATIVFLLLVRVAMIVTYDILREKVISSRKRLNVLIYGVDDKAVGLETRLVTSPHYNVVGYLNHGHRLRGQHVNRVKIF